MRVAERFGSLHPYCTDLWRKWAALKDQPKLSASALADRASDDDAFKPFHIDGTVMIIIIVFIIALPFISMMYVLAADTIAELDKFEDNNFNSSMKSVEKFDANSQLAYAIEKIGPMVLAMKNKFDDYCDDGSASLSEQKAIGKYVVY